MEHRRRRSWIPQNGGDLRALFGELFFGRCQQRLILGVRQPCHRGEAPPARLQPTHLVGHEENGRNERCPQSPANSAFWAASTFTDAFTAVSQLAGQPDAG